MLKRGLTAAAVATAVALSVAVSAVSTAAFAVPAKHHHHSHRGTQVRAYDTRLLARANDIRTASGDRAYSMNHKLWNVAHAWAKHMARTGILEHNPRLQPLISHKCPQWNNLGENVGVVYGKTTNKQMFTAYMNSPEHKANILDKHYRQVGFASVKVIRHHQVQEWDVMDFGNHC